MDLNPETALSEKDCEHKDTSTWYSGPHNDEGAGSAGMHGVHGGVWHSQ